MSLENHDIASLSRDELEICLNELGQELNTAGDDVQLANIDLQNALQKQEQTMEELFAIAKMLHDTAMLILNKKKGVSLRRV